jgi:hypothetical protein
VTDLWIYGDAFEQTAHYCTLSYESLVA